MYLFKRNIIVLNKMHCKYLADVLQHRSIVLLISIVFSCTCQVNATNYLVSTKTDLQTRMTNAQPGDTVIVANGTYSFGQINFTNTKGTSTSTWIVLKAQTFNGVTFTGSTYLQFSGKRILITGFRFASGNSGTTDVIQFRNSSGTAASYCRLNNITIDSYNSDSTGSVAGTSPDTDNKWVSLYGTNNRVDHCTFINKANAGATVVVWYDNNTYPQKSTTTLHLIDSNYFKGRGYQGANGGESMRLGTSSVSRSNGYNIVEYNLFEDCTQVEPEIISNKTNFNTYRYNTFMNCYGGMTMRHGRYCSIYGNFFIVNNSSVTRSYGVRLIDKGHKVYNNYFEGLLGNKNSLTSLRCPIILYNGLTSTTDTTTSSKASGYFPADSCIVAYNTIVNCSGGGGIVLGFTDGGSNTFQPKGIQVSNNLIKMTTGQAAYKESSNTSLTYSAEGNIYNAPNGAGLSPTAGFTSNTLSFGSRVNGILPPPSLVQDASANTSNYTSLLNGIDAIGQNRSATYDVGCNEINGTGTITSYPLDSTLVGAGKPNIILPVRIVSFTGNRVSKSIVLNWKVANEINVNEYIVQATNANQAYTSVASVKATSNNQYQFILENNIQLYTQFRLKIVDADGSYTYSNIIFFPVNTTKAFQVFPNPAKELVNIQLNNSEYKSSTIQVFNSIGLLIKTIQPTSSSRQINTSNWANGNYIIQFIQQNQIIQQQVILLAK